MTAALTGLSCGATRCWQESYETGSVIGAGNFSQVFAAKHKTTGTDAAMKCCLRSDIKRVTALRRERDELAYLWKVEPAKAKRTIIQVKEYITGEAEECLVLECAPHGSLYDFVCRGGNTVTEPEACFVLQTLLQAVDFMHSWSRVHRDIKPQNILVMSVDEGSPRQIHVRLCDFGIAKEVQDSWARANSAGDFSVMDAEVQSRIEERTPMTCDEYRKNDVFAVGLTAFWLLSGRAPSRSLVEDVVQYPSMRQRYLPHVSEEGRAWIAWLLQDEARRPFAFEALKSEYMLANGRQASSVSSTEGGDIQRLHSSETIALQEAPLTEGQFDAIVARPPPMGDDDAA